MTTENIDIVFRQRGAENVQRQTRAIGESARVATVSVDYFKKALATLGVGLGAAQLKAYVDEWGKFNGRIRAVTKTNEEFTAVQQRLFQVAQRSRQSIGSISDVYVRIARAGKELGKSQADVIRFTELVGKTLAANRVPTEQADGALTQLGQAMGGGIVRAEEFNSILEGASPILQVVADNMEGVNGSIGKLRALVLEGKLTSQAFFEAMIKGGADVEAAFEKGPVTIGQAFTRLNSEVTRFVGELDAAIGASSAFSSAVVTIADNLRGIAGAAVGAGAALGAAFVPAKVVAMRTAVLALWGAVRAHPFALLATAVSATLGYFVAMRDQITLTADSSTTLGTLLSTVFSNLASSVTQGLNAVTTFAAQLAQQAGKSLQGVSAATEEAISNWTSQYTRFYSDVEQGWFGGVRAAARTLDAISALVQGSVRAVGVSFLQLPGLMKNAFFDALNSVNSVVESAINSLIRALNSVLDTFGGTSIDLVKIAKFEVDKNYFANTGREIAFAFEDGFTANAGWAERWLDRQVAAANEAQAAINKAAESAKAAASQQVNATPTAALGVNPHADAYKQLIATLDPVREATRKYREEQALLNQMLKVGGTEHTRYSELLRQKYADAMNPLAALNKQLEQQIQLASMTAKARDIEAQVLQHVNDLRRQGVQVTTAETDAIRQQLQVLQQANDLRSLQDQLLQNTQAAQQKNIADQLKAAGSLGLQGADLSNVVNQAFGLQQDSDSFSAQIAQVQEHQALLEQLRQQDMLNEETYSAARVALYKREQDLKVQSATQFFGAVAQLQSSRSKKLARIGKAAAIAEAMMNVYTAATKAYAQGGIFGAASSASVITAGLGLVQQIRGMNTEGFMTGGSFKVGGSGGADSQMVAFRASPGEQVTVSTPKQVRKGSEHVGIPEQAKPVTITPKIVNVLDPALVGDFLNTDAGEQVIMNIVQRNRGSLA